MTRPGNGRARVLIAGAGPAGLEAALALRELAGESIALELLDPAPRFVYRALAVAEAFGRGEPLTLDLRTFADDVGARLRPATLQAVDDPSRRVAAGDGEELPYDHLLVAVGGRAREAVPGALTFRGQRDEAVFRALLDEVRNGVVRRVVFACPSGATWPVPLYELALLTAGDAAAVGAAPELHLVTPEPMPLALFGETASREVAALLAERGIAVHTCLHPLEVEPGGLRVAPAGRIPADRVVALPRIDGPAIPGLPRDRQGFVPTDALGRVAGVEGVYAAGDATRFPIKQGGIAAQQADTAAATIAAAVGAPVEPEPFDPVVRGLLLTGDDPLFLRASAAGGRGDTSVAATELLWWPPSKIAARRLSHYLAQRALLAEPPGLPVAGSS